MKIIDYVTLIPPIPSAKDQQKLLECSKQMKELLKKKNIKIDISNRYEEYKQHKQRKT